MYIHHVQCLKSVIQKYHYIIINLIPKKNFSKFSHSHIKLSYFVCFFLTSVLLIAGCGYVSTSSYLEHIDTIRIEPIQILDADIAYDNVTQRPYDEVIHEKMINRFNRKWSDGSDSKFTIRIMDYDIKEQGYGPSGNVEMLRMSLQVEYEFIDNVRNNLIARTDNHLQIHDFYIVENRGEPPETVDQAKTLIVDELIEDLYNQLAEQW
ncbi:hypothetical protein C6497_09250 [Candidatus Poribacteria bacterium]|nr:MAG: hypothetical protein C6497_09250 [Candidatus Poribacteria bacterium]